MPTMYRLRRDPKRHLIGKQILIQVIRPLLPIRAFRLHIRRRKIHRILSRLMIPLDDKCIILNTNVDLFIRLDGPGNQLHCHRLKNHILNKTIQWTCAYH